MDHGRLPWMEPEGLTPEQRALYESIAHGSRAQAGQAFPLVDEAGRLNGPFNAMLVVPALGEPVQRLGSAIRFGTMLSDRVRELAILLVAAHEQSAFEWYAHRAVALRSGISVQEVDAVRSGTCPASCDETEQEALAVVQALLSLGDLTDERYAAAVALLGVEQIMELVVLVGHYRALALSLRVWRVPLPAGVVDELTAPAE